MDLNLTGLLITIPLLLVSLTLHELGHAAVASMLGDQTARRLGRLTLNPLKHLDPVGAIALLITVQAGFGIGWAKPVPVNPYQLRYGPRVGMAIVAAAGPMMNVLIALVGVVVFQTTQVWGPSKDVTQILVQLIMMNVGLTVFNMLPLAPLDGEKVLSGVLPAPVALQFMKLQAWGPGTLLVLIFVAPLLGFPVLSSILIPPMRGLLEVLTFVGQVPADAIMSVLIS